MSFHAGRKLRASELDDIEDRVTELETHGVWADYTPTWRASGTQPVTNNGVLQGKYVKIGKLVILRMNLIMGPATTFGTGNYSWDLPFTAAAAAPFSTQWIWTGASTAIDTGTAYRFGTVFVLPSATTFTINDSSGNPWAQTNPHTWANTDYMQAQVAYEAA